jgi:hypothetical protein
VPVTVRVNDAPPGTTASGLNGWLINGTGFAAEALLTLIEFEVPVIEAVAVSVAVMVWGPAVFRVTEKVPVPFASIELAGSTAWASVLVKCTVPE